ncbi:SlyX protein [Kineobactrum sediminis]|uniref:SlyX protein n=1 Tax=Kineobactrum sediminis TaxID=1905677 RepID=A0A2N5Y2Q9_9GAMM|nr:SlyX family protein [Kineobactrum sediminis]PLW82684.1 SlyX protein [Kineobactrum sediminis]
MKKKHLKLALDDLQSQFAFQEDVVQALQDAVAAQQRELLLFRRQLELLKQRQDEQGSQLDERPGDTGPELPPHY